MKIFPFFCRLGSVSLSLFFASVVDATPIPRTPSVIKKQETCVAKPLLKRSCLHDAVLNQQPQRVAELLKAGMAWDNKSSISQTTPFTLALHKVFDNTLSLPEQKKARKILHAFLSHEWVSQDLCGAQITLRQYLAKKQPALLKKCDELLAADPFRPTERGFFDLVMQGGIKQVQRLIEESGSIDLVSAKGETLLELAISLNQTEIARYLIEKKANIHAADVLGEPLLQSAISNGNLELVKCLVEAGVEVEQCNTYGATPLLLAVVLNKTEIAAYLIAKHANVYVPDSLLEIAIRNKNIELVQHLVKAGVKVEYGSAVKKSPLALAVSLDAMTIADYLVAQQLHLRDDAGNSLLHNAVMQNDLALVQYLLEADEDIDCKNNHGDTPLAVAVILNHTDIASFLIDYNANVNVRDAGGYALSDIASMKENKELEALLLSVAALQSDTEDSR